MKICLQMIEYVNKNNIDIKRYITTSKRIVKIYEENSYKKNIINIGKPVYNKVKFLDNNYICYQSLGMENIQKCGFVLVAGGLGERLHSKTSKLTLPINQISGYSYLKLYIKTILSYKRITTRELYICIMTSQNTDKIIKHYLQENQYFGISKSNLYFVIQENVPSFSSKHCDLNYCNGKIVTRPHGHGDIHNLLLKV